jgi:hypothetical protein
MHKGNHNSKIDESLGPRKLGSGMVMGYEEDRMTVLFDEVGYKTLSVPVVEENALLVADDEGKDRE